VIGAETAALDGGGGLGQVLAGLRIVEIGHFVAAPFCTRLLADLGADVIKVEPPSGDPVRQWGEMVDGHSLWWSMHGRNKRSVAIDLKSPRGVALALNLAAHCDALVENFRPGQLARFGLTPERLRRRNPNLIICHISGYGQTGPDRDRAAFGLIGEAVGGLRFLTDHAPGTSDLPPVRVGVSIGDSVAGLYAAFGILSALWQRDRAGGDGAARTVDVALSESVLSLMEGMLPEYGALGKIKQPTGGAIATAAPTNAYPTRDGLWVLIGANSDPLFLKLAAAMGRPDLCRDPDYRDNQRRVANAAALDADIACWTAGQDAAALMALLDAADIPNSKVYTAADCAEDRQYRARNMVRLVRVPLFDRDVLQAGIVPHVPESPGAIGWPGPDIGAHTDEVLAGMLALSASEIGALREAGAIR
jgi:crotonobetainyl-CoA:carnitine CoA-transferase CaiB-like acyl-CoA transferase